jgi:hypothetical protein
MLQHARSPHPSERNSPNGGAGMMCGAMGAAAVDDPMADKPGPRSQSGRECARRGRETAQSYRGETCRAQLAGS